MNNEEMIRLAKNGDKDMEERFFIENEGLIHHIAKQHRKSIYDYSDLFETAQFGMFKAYMKFDLEKGNLFATYASMVMKNEILMMFRRDKKRKDDLSFEMTLANDENGSELKIEDVLEDESSYHIDEKINNHSIDKLVEEFSKTLSDRDRNIFKLHFYENMRQQHIGEIVSATQSYVSRIIKKLSKDFSNFAKSKEFC